MLKSPAVRILALASVCSISLLCAQAQSAAPAANATPAATDAASPQLAVRTTGTRVTNAEGKDVPDAQKYIEREFGPGYLLETKMPVLLGDLDGDGLEDAVFIVKGGNPLVGAGAFNYTVLDPYDGYWSFGDPTLTAHISQTDPGPHYHILIAHDWRGEKAKAKFVFINLPFKQIALTPTRLQTGVFKKNKKVVAAISTIETDGQTGAVFWNGRTYKFVQLGNVDD